MTVTGARMVDVTLPAEQSEGTESVISLWFKQVGEAVAVRPDLRLRGLARRAGWEILEART